MGFDAASVHRARARRRKKSSRRLCLEDRCGSLGRRVRGCVSGVYLLASRKHCVSQCICSQFLCISHLGRWAVDFAGGTKPANPSGPGFLRGALPGRVLFPCWCGRSGGAPASASASMTATDGRLALRRVSRSNGTPRWEARGSMLRWTFAVWVPFSPSPSTLS